MIFQKGESSSYQLQDNKSTLSDPKPILHDVSRSCESGIQEVHRKNGSLLLYDIWVLNGEDSRGLAPEQVKLEEPLSGWLYFTHLPGPRSRGQGQDCLQGVIRLGDLRVFRLLTWQSGLEGPVSREMPRGRLQLSRLESHTASVLPYS